MVGLPIEVWVQRIAEQGLFIDLSALSANSKLGAAEEMIAYPTEGCFVQYLISVFRIEKFKVLNQHIKNDITHSVDEIYVHPLILVLSPMMSAFTAV